MRFLIFFYLTLCILFTRGLGEPEGRSRERDPKMGVIKVLKGFRSIEGFKGV
jgi:hypothetical protein